MAGKTKSKAAKNLSKKKNKANKKAKTAAMLNDADAVAGDVGVTQEQLQAAGDDIDKATQYSDSLDLYDEPDDTNYPSSPPQKLPSWHLYSIWSKMNMSTASQDDVAKLEAENKEKEMTTGKKVKQIAEETGSKSSYPTVRAEYAAEAMETANKKSCYPSVPAEYVTETMETGIKKSSYPGVDAHHATTNVNATDSGAMGPPQRKSSLAPQSKMSADGPVQDFDKLSGANGVLEAIIDNRGRPLPSTPVICGNDSADVSGNAVAAGYLDNYFDEQLEIAKLALKNERGAADINAFALTKQKEMEEGEAQEEEYDPAKLDLNSENLKNIQRDHTFFSSEDKMDYVMGIGQENDVSAANSGDAMYTPTTSEDGAAYNLVVECTNKKAADAIGGHLIEAAEDQDITRGITNVSVVSVVHKQAGDQIIGPDKLSSGHDAAQLDADGYVSSEVPGLDTMKGIFNDTSAAHVKGELPKPGQGSVTFNPLAGQTHATIIRHDASANRASQKFGDKQTLNDESVFDWPEDAMKGNNDDDDAKRAEEPQCFGVDDTIVAIDDELVDLDEVIAKPKSKKSESKNKNHNNAVTENVSASASGTDVSDNAHDEQAGTSISNESEVDKQQIAKLMSDIGMDLVPSDTDKEPPSLDQMSEEMKTEAQQSCFLQKCAYVSRQNAQTTSEKKVDTNDVARQLWARNLAGHASQIDADKLSQMMQQQSRADIAAFIHAKKDTDALESNNVEVQKQVREFLTLFMPVNIKGLNQIANTTTRALLQIASKRDEVGKWVAEGLDITPVITAMLAAGDITSDEVLALKPQFEGILELYSVKHDVKFLAALLRILAPFKNEIDQNAQSIQEVSAKVAVIQKLVSSFNGRISNGNFRWNLVKSEAAVLKESDRRRGVPDVEGDNPQVTGSAGGFMGVTYHTIQQDLRAIRKLTDERRDISERSSENVEDVFRQHQREPDGHHMKIPEVVEQLKITMEMVAHQLNVVTCELGALERRHTNHGSTILSLLNDTQKLRIEAAGSGSDGAALDKAVELEAIIEGLAVRVGTATRNLNELSAFTHTEVAKHEKLIGTMRADIVGLQRMAKATKSTIDEHGQELAALKVANQLNAENVSTLKGNIDSVVNRATAPGRKVDRLITEQNTMKKDIERNDKSIGELFAAGEFSMTKFESDMKTQDRKLGKVDKRLSSMDTKISSATNRLDATNSLVNKMWAALERGIEPVELEVGGDEDVIMTESLREKIGKLVKKTGGSDATTRTEGPKKKPEHATKPKFTLAMTNATVKALTERVADLETATATSNRRTDIPGAVVTSTTDDGVPGTSQPFQSNEHHLLRVRLPRRGRSVSENVRATPAAPSSAPMAPHPTPPGSASMPPPMIGHGLPPIFEEQEQSSNIVEQNVFSLVMDGAVQVSVGGFGAPVMNMVNAPMGLMEGSLVPAMMNGPPDLMPGSGIPPQSFAPPVSYAPLTNGPPLVNATPPMYQPVPDPIQRQFQDHWNIMNAIGTRVNQVENAMGFHQDKLRQVRQDIRYEIGAETARIEQEMSERFRHISRNVSRVEENLKGVTGEQKKLEGLVAEIREFVGMPPSAEGEGKQNLERRVREIMEFVGMKKGEEVVWG